MYRARALDGTPVILEVLRENAAPGEREAFRRAFAIQSALPPESVPNVLEIRDSGGLICIAYEDAGAIPLSSWLGSHPNGPGRLSACFASLAWSLGVIHSSGVVHRNLNPGHALVDPKSLHCRLTGFYKAAPVHGRIGDCVHDPGPWSGLEYLPPEMAGKAGAIPDFRSDLYSMGAMLYEALTGAPPYHCQGAAEKIHAHLAADAVDPRELSNDVPEPLACIAMKLLAKRPEGRYQSAWGLEADLRECAARFREGGLNSVFDLGENDVPVTFRMPGKLYGRDRELDTLTMAMRRAQRGEGGAVLVSGYSGVGKTSLVSELAVEAARRGGVFLYGKYDQARANIPYNGLAQAFQVLAGLVLGKPEAGLAAWRQALISGLGPNAALLKEVVPDIEMLLGQNIIVRDADPLAAKARFVMAFRQFMDAAAGQERFLVVFLDDLQWVDEASLELLKLMIRERFPRVLLLGAYRSNEVSRGHPLGRMLAALDEEQANVTPLELRPLQRPDVARLLADAFSLPERSVAALVGSVMDKTGGNPFFINQFMLSLHEDGLMGYDPGAGRWRWDIRRIKAREVSDNVAHIALQRFASLPEATRRCLGLAACFGPRFDLAEVASLSGMTRKKVSREIAAAMSAGFVQPQALLWPKQDSGACRFAHDRLHQAAYDFLDPGRRKALHLEIGRMLMAGLPKDRREERLFETAQHMNHCLELIQDNNELYEVIRLNISAGKKAMDAMAHAEALGYLQACAGFFPPKALQEECALVMEHARLSAWAAMLSGGHESCSRFIDQGLEHAKTPLDRAGFHLCRLYLLCKANDLPALLETSKRVLLELGAPLPQGGLGPAVDEMLARLEKRLPLERIPGLAERPVDLDPMHRALMEIISQVARTVSPLDPEYWKYLICFTIEFQLDHGNVPEAAGAYTAYGMLLCMQSLKNAAKAHALGELSIALSKRLGVEPQLANIYLVLGGMIGPWSRHARHCREYLEKGARTHLQYGEVLESGSCRVYLVLMEFLLGGHLQNAAKLADESWDFCRRMKLLYPLAPLARIRGLLAELRGGAESVETLQPQDAEGGDTGGGMASWNGLLVGALQTFCLYLHGEAVKALEAAEKTEQLYFTHLNSFIAAEWPFIYGLALAKACSGCAPGERPAHMGLLRRKSAMLAEMAEACAENFLCRSALIEAELARLEGRHWDALGRYETAMESARQGGFVFVEALAAELAGGFWLDQGNQRMAAPHLQRARSAYEAWGAKRKVELLEVEHPGLLAGSGIGRKAAEDSVSWDRLGLEAIMEAAGVITSEMKIEPLMRKLMRVLLKNAGAQHGCFLIAHDAGLAAAACARGGEVRVFTDNLPGLDGLEGVAPGIVRYAARTGEAVAIDDAALDSRFRHELHADGRPPRSVMCVPVRRQGELFGVAYFENNLLSGIFTPERLETVRMLASQAAIALENARLYEDLSAHARRIGEAYDSLQTEVKQRKEAERKAHMLAQKIISAQEQERRRIALDLHDNVAQNLSLSRILCQTMSKRGEISPDIGSKELQRLTELIQQAVDDVRGMAYELRPPALEQFGLIRALDDYCRDFADLCGIGVEFMSAGMENAALDTEKEINIYRLVQEALNNIQKHAKAKRAWVKIVMSEPDVLITVRDDGKGFDVEGRGFQAAGKQHMGLQGMMERAGLLGGEFSVRSVKNKGTIVSIKIPCRESP